MKNYYEEKMNFHFKEYQLSVDAKKDKAAAHYMREAAAHHMREYLNYKQMHENKKGAE